MPLLKWTQIVGSIRNSFESLLKPLIRFCHEVALNDLLSKNDTTDFNMVDRAGWYPIHAAIVIANIEILNKLLQNGANPNLHVKDVPSPLCRAIFEGKEQIVTFLIENGADVNMVDGQDWTPITMAIDKGNMEMIKVLCQNGANLNLSPSRYVLQLQAEL